GRRGAEVTRAAGGTAMADGAAILARCLQDVEDSVPRLVYADWLEENGESLLAEFIRAHARFNDQVPYAEAPPAARTWADRLLGASATGTSFLGGLPVAWSSVPADVPCEFVVSLSLNGPSDDALVEIGGLTSLRYLSLGGHEVTDAGLAALAGL